MGNGNWETPPEFFERCDEAWGPFGLDAAATIGNSKCPYMINEETNALEVEWPIGQGRVWLNPPYINLISWVEKSIEESDRGLLVCMLLPNDTDTRWFQILVDRAEIYTTVGRVKFIDPEGKGRVSPRQGQIVAVIRPPMFGVERPTGIVGRIDA
jgi:phage N-6-adenine-methyltransferase